MANQTEKIIAYLDEITGLKVDVQVRPSTGPIFISEAYSFYSLRVEKSRFLGIVVRHPEDFKLTAFEKHQRYFPTYGDDDREYKQQILIADNLPLFVRKRLIEKRIPFIVPQMQLYWPELGLEFRSHIRNKRVHQSSENIDPSTQAVLIGALNGLYPTPITPKELSARLHYSPMTMTRALNTIESLGIGRVQKSGKRRLLSFPDDKESLWNQIKLQLINPVRETGRFLERDVAENIKILAGESALAEMSSLVSPQTRTYAVGRETWKKIKNKMIPYLESNEPGTCEVQVWRYDPELFSIRNHVDVFSLYLSLKDNINERVEIALNKTLENHL